MHKGNEKDFFCFIVEKYIDFLKNDMEIELINEEYDVKEFKTIFIKNIASSLEVYASESYEVYFEYEEKLLKKLVNSFTYGEKLEKNEYLEIKNSVCTEVLNTVLGHAITYPSDKLIDISTPKLINNEVLLESKKNDIYESFIKTIYGNTKIIIKIKKEKTC